MSVVKYCGHIYTLYNNLSSFQKKKKSRRVFTKIRCSYAAVSSCFILINTARCSVHKAMSCRPRRPRTPRGAADLARTLSVSALVHFADPKLSQPIAESHSLAMFIHDLVNYASVLACYMETLVNISARMAHVHENSYKIRVP